MSTIAPVVVSLFVFLTFVVGQRDTLIATGRGVLAPDHVLKKVHEVPFNTSYRWQLIQDSRFPNGYFIHSNYYNQVWDVSGGAATNGAPILLYQKKDTLAGTKNQRWVNSSVNQFEIIMNSNYVAKLNSNKRLVLATKSASDPFQKFYLIDVIHNLTRLSINNQRNECIRIVAAPSVLGDHLNTTQCDQWVTYTTYRGGKVDVFDAAGNYLQQDYVMHSRDVTLSFLVSYPTKLLEGTATWKGPTRQPDPTIDSNVRLTFTATFNEDWRNGAINGSGSDAFGSFRVQGDYSGRPGTEGDYVYLFKSYANTYRLVQTCYAESIGATVIEGLCESSASSEAPPSNSFRWEKQI